MSTRITANEQIESLRKDDTLIDMSNKKRPVRYSISFICTLYVKVVSGIAKNTIRKIFSPKVLLSDEWHIE
jgi:hypothetical protein